MISHFFAFLSQHPFSLLWVSGLPEGTTVPPFRDSRGINPTLATVVKRAGQFVHFIGYLATVTG